MFGRPDHQAAYDLIIPTIAAMEPGEPPDLGSLLGDDDSDAAVMLRGLAFLDRPLPDAAELLRKVQVGALDRRIQEMRRRIESLDSETEPEAYSGAFRELIALEKQRRDLWSHE
jgi:hypothetical protein